MDASRSPILNFWVEVNVLVRHERWLAVAFIADEPQIGLGTPLKGAVREALAILGAEAAESLLESVPIAF